MRSFSPPASACRQAKLNLVACAKSSAQLILHLVSISPKPNGGTPVEDCTAAERALILAKADVMAVSRVLELALFMDAKLDVSKVLAK
jgi:hypothetical protein